MTMALTSFVAIGLLHSSIASQPHTGILYKMSVTRFHVISHVNIQMDRCNLTQRNTKPQPQNMLAQYL